MSESNPVANNVPTTIFSNTNRPEYSSLSRMDGNCESCSISFSPVSSTFSPPIQCDDGSDSCFDHSISSGLHAFKEPISFLPLPNLEYPLSSSVSIPNVDQTTVSLKHNSLNGTLTGVVENADSIYPLGQVRLLSGREADLLDHNLNDLAISTRDQTPSAPSIDSPDSFLSSFLFRALNDPCNPLPNILAQSGVIPPSSLREVSPFWNCSPSEIPSSRSMLLCSEEYSSLALRRPSSSSTSSTLDFPQVHATAEGDSQDSRTPNLLPLSMDERGCHPRIFTNWESLSNFSSALNSSSTFSSQDPLSVHEGTRPLVCAYGLPCAAVRCGLPDIDSVGTSTSSSNLQCSHAGSKNFLFDISLDGDDPIDPSCLGAKSPVFLEGMNRESSSSNVVNISSTFDRTVFVHPLGRDSVPICGRISRPQSIEMISLTPCDVFVPTADHLHATARCTPFREENSSCSRLSWASEKTDESGFSSREADLCRGRIQSFFSPVQTTLQNDVPFSAGIQKPLKTDCSLTLTYPISDVLGSTRASIPPVASPRANIPSFNLQSTSVSVTTCSQSFDETPSSSWSIPSNSSSHRSLSRCSIIDESVLRDSPEGNEFGENSSRRRLSREQEFSTLLSPSSSSSSFVDRFPRSSFRSSRPWMNISTNRMSPPLNSSRVSLRHRRFSPSPTLLTGQTCRSFQTISGPQTIVNSSNTSFSQSNLIRSCNQQQHQKREDSFFASKSTCPSPLFSLSRSIHPSNSSSRCSSSVSSVHSQPSPPIIPSPCNGSVDGEGEYRTRFLADFAGGLSPELARTLYVCQEDEDNGRKSVLGSPGFHAGRCFDTSQGLMEAVCFQDGRKSDVSEEKISSSPQEFAAARAADSFLFSLPRHVRNECEPLVQSFLGQLSSIYHPYCCPSLRSLRESDVAPSFDDTDLPRPPLGDMTNCVAKAENVVSGSLSQSRFENFRRESSSRGRSLSSRRGRESRRSRIRNRASLRRHRGGVSQRGRNQNMIPGNAPIDRRSSMNSSVLLLDSSSLPPAASNSTTSHSRAGSPLSSSSILSGISLDSARSSNASDEALSMITSDNAPVSNEIFPSGESMSVTSGSMCYSLPKITLPLNFLSASHSTRSPRNRMRILSPRSDERCSAFSTFNSPRSPHSQPAPDTSSVNNLVSGSSHL